MAWQLGSRFAGLLPGISTAMLKVVMGDTKQGHHVFCVRKRIILSNLLHQLVLFC